MDTSVSDITFDEKGICNYCSDFLKNSGSILEIDTVEQRQKLEALIAAVKKSGKGKKYDCIVGVSGGVDSSWALVQAVKHGLRPLAVHMDNGWNSELAQNNIANLVRALGVDLYTHVIDWEEYKNLMLAFLEADVIDVELLYDNAMFGLNYFQANKYGIKYILSGMNTTSEGMAIPRSWNWHKFDKKNIVEIGKRFRNVKIDTFPAIGTIYFIYSKYVKGIQWVPFPDYFKFNKVDVMKMLEAEYGYKPYPYKHYESIFTRYYQGYLLPIKFNVDKRRVHLGTLVAAGQLSRDLAIRDLEDIAYETQAQLEQDEQYFLKKMGWSKKDLEDYLARPEQPHSAYPSEKHLYDTILNSDDRPLYKILKNSYKNFRAVIRRIKNHTDFTNLK
jgi:N-acetyl sugar amidotransferase